MKIKFFYDIPGFRLKESGKIRRTLVLLYASFGFTRGDVNIVFTTDEKLLPINIEFLNHDYYTDVITFSESTGMDVTGEIYISIETVKRNSFNYNVSLKDEVSRVVFHGALHMCGLNDSTVKEKEKMKSLEDYWLEILSKE